MMCVYCGCTIPEAPTLAPDDWVTIWINAESCPGLRTPVLIYAFGCLPDDLAAGLSPYFLGWYASVCPECARMNNLSGRHQITMEDTNRSWFVGHPPEFINLDVLRDKTVSWPKNKSLSWWVNEHYLNGVRSSNQIITLERSPQGT